MLFIRNTKKKKQYEDSYKIVMSFIFWFKAYRFFVHIHLWPESFPEYLSYSLVLVKVLYKDWSRREEEAKLSDLQSHLHTPTGTESP